MFRYIQNRVLTCVKLLLALTDLICINLVFITTLSSLSPNIISAEGGYYSYYPSLALEFNLIAILVANYMHLYRNETIEQLENIFRATAKTTLLLLLIFSTGVIFAHKIDGVWQLLSILTLLIALYCLLSRFLLTYIYSTLFRRFNWYKRIALIGDDDYIQFFTSNLDLKNPFFSVNTIQHQDHETLATKETRLQQFRNYFETCQNQGIYDIFIVNSPDISACSGELISDATHRCLQVNFVPAKVTNIGYVFDQPTRSLSTPILRSNELDMSTIESRLKKRIADLLISGFVIVFILSWLIPLVGAVIKVQSPGPIFFKQQRSGRNNKTFNCYKFRSMVVNETSSKQQADKTDSRITPIGRFLRKTNLDEFPQFINVFLGQMSIVGPRPHMLFHTEYYSELIKNYMMRHFVKPGITGWAQVNGFRGETKDPELMAKRVEHDLEYMNNWSTVLDFKIIFLTAINMLRGEKNAY